MKAVILAAGRGTRMGALCDHTPKPMLPIHGRPKLTYTLEVFPQEITEVLFVIGYLGEQIKDFFGTSYHGRKISYVVQDELNGTGGAVMLARDFVGDERFMVLMGDDLYLKTDLKRLMQYDFSLLAYETEYAEQFGLVTKDQDSYLLDVIERPHPHVCGLVNTAAYVLSPAYFDMPLMPISATEYGLPQTLVAQRDKHPIRVITTTTWLPIGDAEALARAQKEITQYV